MGRGAVLIQARACPIPKFASVVVLSGDSRQMIWRLAIYQSVKTKQLKIAE
jgi:hypothetical protein